MKDYRFKFQYKKTETSAPVIERFFISTTDTDARNACEIAMLQFISKHNYYSAKLLTVDVM